MDHMLALIKENKKHISRGVEFVLLFFGVPVLLYFDSFILHPSLVLLPVLAALFIYFKRKKDFSFKTLVRFDVPKSFIWKNVAILFLVALLLTGFILIWEPQHFLNLPMQNPKIWILLGLTYPPFSAYPQEIIYRTFLSNRYGILFRKKSHLIWASAITFSFAHIVYYSPLSMGLTLIAGIYLAYLYIKTGSVLFTTIVHSILGMLIFTLGLGSHFWLNMEKYL